MTSKYFVVEILLPGMKKEQAKKITYKELTPSEWVDSIIARGIEMGASDIHINASPEALLVRFRIDGVLHLIESMPLTYLETVIARLKVMAQLDTTERRLPQDGHILFQSGGPSHSESIDLRLSIFPTVLGEVAVIRILNRKEFLFDNLEQLGMDSDIAEKLRSVLQQPSGMILVAGPGGSGKSATLYTILNFLKSQKQEQNIITLEDPVELFLPGVRQSHIHPEIGFTFVIGLRSILRQDPNVIMIGEIRDDETAEISIRAALMGALFFSTIHTINSIGAIIRFLELGLPPSLIAASLIAIISRRLVRTICPNCKIKASPSRKLIEMSGISKEDELKLYEGKGCDFCHGSGYHGRTGVFEVMFVDKEIQRLIIERVPFTEIEKQAKINGMRTLREAAIKKALEGITTLEEAFRVTPS